MQDWWHQKACKKLTSLLHWDDITVYAISDQERTEGLPAAWSLIQAAVAFSGSTAILFHHNQIPLGICFPRQIETALQKSHLVDMKDRKLSEYLLDPANLDQIPSFYSHPFSVTNSRKSDATRNEAYMLMDWSCVTKPVVFQARQMQNNCVFDQLLRAYFESIYRVVASLRVSASKCLSLQHLTHIEANYLRHVDFTSEEHRQYDLVCRTLMAYHIAGLMDTERALALDLLSAEAVFWQARIELLWPTENLVLRLIHHNSKFKYFQRLAQKPLVNTKRWDAWHYLIKDSPAPVHIDFDYKYQSGQHELVQRINLFLKPGYKWLPQLHTEKDVRELFLSLERLPAPSSGQRFLYDDEEACDTDDAEEIPAIEHVRRTWIMNNAMLCQRASPESLASDSTGSCFVPVALDSNSYTVINSVRDSTHSQLLLDRLPLRFFCFVRRSGYTELRTQQQQLVSVLRKVFNRAKGVLSAPAWLFCSDGFEDICYQQSGSPVLNFIGWNGFNYEMLLVPDIILLDLMALHALLPKLTASEGIQFICDIDLYKPGEKTLPYLDSAKQVIHPSANTIAFEVALQQRSLDALKAHASVVTTYESDASEWALRGFLSIRTRKMAEARASHSNARLAQNSPGWSMPTCFFQLPTEYLEHTFTQQTCLFKCLPELKCCEACHQRNWDGVTFLSYINFAEICFGLYVRYVRQLYTTRETTTLHKAFEPHLKAAIQHAKTLIPLAATICVDKALSFLPAASHGVLSWLPKDIKLAAEEVLCENVRKIIEDLGCFGIYNPKASKNGNVSFSGDGTSQSFTFTASKRIWSWWKCSHVGRGQSVFRLFDVACEVGSSLARTLAQTVLGTSAVVLPASNEDRAKLAQQMALVYMKQHLGLATLKRKEPSAPGTEEVKFKKRDTIEQKLEHPSTTKKIAIATIWPKSGPLTPEARIYLSKHRHITDERILTSAARFCTSTPYEQGFMSAVVFPIYYNNEMYGVHCIYLSAATHNKTNSKPKLTFGHAIPHALVHNPSVIAVSDEERQIAARLPGSAVALVGEGPETMLSVASAFPAMTCYASLSICNLQWFRQVPFGSSIVVCADNDNLATFMSEMKLLRAATDYRIWIARPPSGIKDFNVLTTQPNWISTIQKCLFDAEEYKQ